MTNITLLNNTILKLYNSNENKSTNMLTLEFLCSDYTLEDIGKVFSDSSKENFSEIIKTTESGDYITTFLNYTQVQKIGIEKVTISSESTKEITTLNELGKEIITTIPTSRTSEVEIIIVGLRYEDPTTQLVNKIYQQINPSINIETCTLEELQKFQQSKNKDAMNDFFRTHPLLHTDGLYYGVEDEDRKEMSEEFLGYMLEIETNPDAKLEWHSKGTACTPRTKEEFASIAIAVRNYTKPYFRKMQEIKEAIFSATTKEDVLAIKIFNEN